MHSLTSFGGFLGLVVTLVDRDGFLVYFELCYFVGFEYFFSIRMSAIISAVLSLIIGPAKYPAIVLFSVCTLST